MVKSGPRNIEVRQGRREQVGRKSNRSAARGRAGLQRIEDISDRQKRLKKQRKQNGGDRSAKGRGVGGRELRADRAEQSGQTVEKNVVLPLDASVWKRPGFGVWGVALLIAFCFSFWQTLQWLELRWREEPDYSHGYLVIPLALTLLWIRRDTFPGVTSRVDWRGCSLILLAVLMRFIGRVGYMDFLDGWAIAPFVGGIIWMTMGLSAARWSAPAVLFLLMLVPMPFRMETMLSWKLQGLATLLSTATLRICGLPAIAEGHVIWVNDTELMIEKACSGLRIFMGMIALAFFWAATVRRSWIDRVVLLLAAIPLAILTNSARISITAILYEAFPSESARQSIHDWSGYLMIPTAALLLWLFKYFWECLYRPVRLSSAGDMLKQRLKQPTPQEDQPTKLQIPTSQS